MGGKTGTTKGTTKSRSTSRSRKTAATPVNTDAAGPAAPDSPVAPAPEESPTPPRKPRRRASAKVPAAATLPEAQPEAALPAADASAADGTVSEARAAEAADAQAPAPKPRRRNATPRKRKPVVKAPEAAEVADIAEVGEATEARAIPDFADGLAAAFLVHPSEVGGDGQPAGAAPCDPMHRDPTARPAPHGEEDAEPDRVVELPFIIDTPPPPVPAPASVSDEWVDLVLEPSKPQPVRRPRAAVGSSSSATTTRTGRRAAASGAAGRAPAPTAAAKVVSAALPPKASPVRAPVVASGTAAAKPAERVGTRWWLVVPLLLVAALVAFFSRSDGRSAPMPPGVIGTWTTSFWMYEHQTLEITRDSIFLTLDEPEEGRYPITKVEVADAGREQAVRLTYRTAAGAERMLDFFADRNPTTALRFRTNSALVWVRSDE